MKNLLELDEKIRTNELDFIKRPIIIRLRNFSEDGGEEFSEKMSEAHNTGQPIIPIVVDSYGGEVYSLNAMISEIQNSKLPVATIVESKAMSCGAWLFSFGTPGYRFVSPHATIMIHDVSSGNHGKVEEIVSDAKETDRLNKKLYEEMAKHCGHDKSYFLDLVHQKGHADWYLKPADAIKHNVADHIKVPDLITRISVDISLE